VPVFPRQSHSNGATTASTAGDVLAGDRTRDRPPSIRRPRDARFCAKRNTARSEGHSEKTQPVSPSKNWASSKNWYAAGLQDQPVDLPIRVRPQRAHSDSRSSRWLPRPDAPRIGEHATRRDARERRKTVRGDHTAPLDDGLLLRRHTPRSTTSLVTAVSSSLDDDNLPIPVPHLWYLHASSSG